jgi:hypothetical protein
VVFEFKSFWLARAEGDDAADGIVGRNAYGHAISRDNFDAEAAHAAAQLGQHFVAGVALNPVEAPAMDSHDRTLHVDEIVLAQTASNPFIFLDNNCATLSGLQASRVRLSTKNAENIRLFIRAEARSPKTEADHSLFTASSTCFASAS